MPGCSCINHGGINSQIFVEMGLNGIRAVSKGSMFFSYFLHPVNLRVRVLIELKPLIYASLDNRCMEHAEYVYLRYNWEHIVKDSTY